MVPETPPTTQTYSHPKINRVTTTTWSDESDLPHHILSHIQAIYLSAIHGPDDTYLDNTTN